MRPYRRYLAPPIGPAPDGEDVRGSRDLTPPAIPADDSAMMLMKPATSTRKGHPWQSCRRGGTFLPAERILLPSPASRKSGSLAVRRAPWVCGSGGPEDGIDPVIDGRAVALRRCPRGERSGSGLPGETGGSGGRRRKRHRSPATAPRGRGPTSAELKDDPPGYSDRFARLIGTGEAGNQHPESPQCRLVTGEEPLPGRIAFGGSRRSGAGRAVPAVPPAGARAGAGGRGRVVPSAAEVVAFFRGRDDRPARTTER